jgi:hypothetical protein
VVRYPGSIVVGALILTATLVAQQAPAPAPADKAEALSAAARKGDAAAVKALLDAGVDVNTKFRYNATALSYACDRGHVEVVKLLLERGADPNVKDTFYNATPLTWAASPAMDRTPRHAEVVRLLLDHGATGAAGALMSAIQASDAPMVKAVLDHKDQVDAASLSRALDTATRAKADEIVKMLEAAGAKPAPVVTLTAEQLARYPGTYKATTTGAEVIVSLADGKLRLDASRLGGPPQIAMTPRSETTFGLEGMGLDITFLIQEGKVVDVTINGTKFVKGGGGA